MPVDLPKLQETILLIARHPSVASLGRTKLNKLVYFADVHHLRATGESITGSEYIKYEHGPVPSRLKKAMKALIRSERAEERLENLGDEYVRYRIVPTGTPTAGVLSTEEINSIESVCQQFGGMTAKKLSERSHEEPAYVYARMLDKLPAAMMHYGRAADPDGL